MEIVINLITRTINRKLKIAYNNSLKWILNLSKYINASKMFVNFAIIYMGLMEC